MTPQPLDTAATEALLAFWRDAGVDACYLSEPVDRTVFVDRRDGPIAFSESRQRRFGQYFQLTVTGTL